MREGEPRLLSLQGYPRSVRYLHAKAKGVHVLRRSSFEVDQTTRSEEGRWEGPGKEATFEQGLKAFG